jgi:hypothetical protein
MDANLRIAQEYRLEHRHSDGTWSPLEPAHHDSVAHDSERGWLKRTIYRCTACREEVAVTEPTDGAGEHADS